MPGMMKCKEAIQSVLADKAMAPEVHVYRHGWPEAGRLLETKALSYEQAAEMIRDYGQGALGRCACRHEAAQWGRACDAPVEDVCAAFGAAALWLVERNLAKPASRDDMLRVLDKAEKFGLVHLADGVLGTPVYLCHCCGCCCEYLRRINETGVSALRPGDVFPQVNADLCTGCGLCAESCHLGGISLNLDGNGNELPVIHPGRCLCCGICAAVCPTRAMQLLKR